MVTTGPVWLEKNSRIFIGVHFETSTIRLVELLTPTTRSPSFIDLSWSNAFPSHASFHFAACPLGWMLYEWKEISHLEVMKILRCRCVYPVTKLPHFDSPILIPRGLSSVTETVPSSRSGFGCTGGGGAFEAPAPIFDFGFLFADRRGSVDKATSNKLMEVLTFSTWRGFRFPDFWISDFAFYVMLVFSFRIFVIFDFCVDSWPGFSGFLDFRDCSVPSPQASDSG